MSLRYVDGDLRDIRLGDIEVVRRIYMVFQDRNWTARPWVILDEDIHAEDDSFTISLSARGTFDAEPFTWTGTLTGSAAGTIRYAVAGATTTPFLRNRLGLCVLHPVKETAGQPVTLERVDGSVLETHFPQSISPDQPFVDMRSLTHIVTPGVTATVRMTGDTFESEDHRNWSDASFKHYCTPISLPFPVTVGPDDRVEQAVEVTLQGDATWVESPPSPVRIDVTDDLRRIPSIGIQLDHDGHRLTGVERSRLAQLRLAHVRVDVDTSAASVDRLRAALSEAEAIGARVAPAVHVADPAHLQALASLASHPLIDRWLVYSTHAKVTDPELLSAASAILQGRVVGGTNLYFTELNRGRPATPEAVAFSVNPQVHATDDQSVLQNAVTLAEIARCARELYPEAWLEISPLTLRPRFNPNATEPDLDHSNTPLPSRVDARQCGDFAAVWSTLALKAVIESSCVDAVTCFEATGWEGLMEREQGSPQPEDFPSQAGGLFPVYDVFAELGQHEAARVCVSSDPARADALAFDDGSVLVANPTRVPQEVMIGGLTLTVPPMRVLPLPPARKA